MKERKKKTNIRRNSIKYKNSNIIILKLYHTGEKRGFKNPSSNLKVGETYQNRLTRPIKLIEFSFPLIVRKITEATKKVEILDFH